MSIGGFNTASASTLKEFGDCLAQTSTHLLIENDQTVSAGTLPALQRFFESMDGAGLSVDMTFDMGTWHGVGECTLQSAMVVRSPVTFVHCTGGQRQQERWIRSYERSVGEEM